MEKSQLNLLEISPEAAPVLNRPEQPGVTSKIATASRKFLSTATNLFDGKGNGPDGLGGVMARLSPTRTPDAGSVAIKPPMLSGLAS